MNFLFRAMASAAVMCVAATASAQFQAQISAPPAGTRVTAGQDVVITFSVTGAVAGIQQITVSGTRDPFGSTVFTYPPSPPTNNVVNETAFYTVPLDVQPDEPLTVTVSAQGYADPQVNASLGLLGPEAGDPPDNDDLADCEELVGNSGMVMGTNVDATKESGEADHADNAGGRSVWYCWTAPDDGALSVNTHGSDFDTLLAIYTGEDFPLTPVPGGSNDDADSQLTSRVDINVDEGETYRIAVDGWMGDSGNIVLNWEFNLLTSVGSSWMLYH